MRFPAKLLLFGEHTINLGSQALAVPLWRFGGKWCFLPSVKMLAGWLDRLGFKDIKIADINKTSTDEQRATDWMTFHSLKNYLDPEDSSKTVEGYPAPLRATLVATKP